MSLPYAKMASQTADQRPSRAGWGHLYLFCVVMLGLIGVTLHLRAMRDEVRALHDSLNECEIQSDRLQDLSRRLTTLEEGFWE